MDANTFYGGWATIRQKVAPIATQLNKNYVQARQYAQEKLGAAEDITELPSEYVDLEKRVDAIREIHKRMVGLGYVWSHPSFTPPTTAISDRVSSVAYNLQQLALGPDQAPPNEPEAPKNLEHAIARVCYDAAEKVSVDEPFGAALSKYGKVMDTVGDESLRTSKELTDKFVTPFDTTLNTTLQRAHQARKRVNATRLRLDAAKSRFKAAAPERQGAIRPEVEHAEDEFVAAVEEAMSLMKAVVEDPEPLRNLSDLVAGQLAYYKRCHELFQELAPEIDEMQVTQEALYRNSRARDDDD